MKKIDIGDRVVFYSGERKSGVVTGVDMGISYIGTIEITYVGTYGECKVYVHPKQCRLLKKKVRRTIWVHKDCIPLGTHILLVAPASGDDRYVECLEKVRK